MDFRLVDRNTVAKACGVSRETLERWIKDGKIPPPKVISRKKVGWLPAELEEWFGNLPTICGQSKQVAKG